MNEFSNPIQARSEREKKTFIHQKLRRFCPKKSGFAIIYTKNCALKIYYYFHEWIYEWVAGRKDVYEWKHTIIWRPSAISSIHHKQPN